MITSLLTARTKSRPIVLALSVYATDAAKLTYSITVTVLRAPARSGWSM